MLVKYFTFNIAFSSLFNRSTTDQLNFSLLNVLTDLLLKSWLRIKLKMLLIIWQLILYINMNSDHFHTHWTYCEAAVTHIYKKCKLTVCNNCMHEDRSFTVCIQTEFNDHYFLYSLCINCHWDVQSIQCSFCKYKSILIWWLLIVLNYVKFKFSLSADSVTSHCHYVAALSAVLIIIIDDVMLSINYNYLLTENVLSTVNKLKIAVKILYH